jgi:hypothetical protein
MIGYVSLPSNFVSLVSADAGSIFSSLSPVAMLIAGVFLGLFAINYVISMFQRARVERHLQAHLASLSPEARERVKKRAMAIHETEAVEEYEDELDYRIGE